MTLGRIANRSVLAVQNPAPAENSGNVSYDGYIRGLSDLPPAIQNKEDRPLISQKMSEQKGHEVNQIEAWVYTHRGEDENNPDILNTSESTACLERYTKKAKELHGPEFDWKKNPISSRALHDCSLGRPHGRWALFNGVVNDTDVIADVRGGLASSAAFKRHRSEEMADELRREREKSTRAETYANNMLSWGMGMHDHCSAMQKLLETLATKQGVPINEIPLLPHPPPALSPSPPCRSPLGSPNHISNGNQNSPVLCAQDQANNSFVQEHNVSSNVSSDEPVHAADQDAFGGFFNEIATGAITFSSLLMSSQMPATE